MTATLKAEVRQTVRRKLAAVTNREVRCVRIVEHLKDLLSGGYPLCGGFRPLESEPDIRALYESDEHQWAFPSLAGENLRFLIPQGPFLKSALGFEEPDLSAAKEVVLSDLDCVIIPGVAFDRNGHRLGRGKGYYDRALAGFKGLKIGVCFSEQFLKNDLVTEAHDVPMDWVVTEKFVYKAL